MRLLRAGTIAWRAGVRRSKAVVFGGSVRCVKHPTVLKNFLVIGSGWVLNARMIQRLSIPAALLFASTTFVLGAEDRREQVLRDRAEVGADAKWIYNDLDAGFDEAKRTGKPLLVVLRCIP